MAGNNPFGSRFHSEVDDMDRRNIVPGLATLTRTLSQKANRISWMSQAITEIRVFFLEKLNVLLIALPFAFISRYAGWGDAATFVLSCLTLVPLAERLGFVTEQLAMYTNDAVGGLLNATFGNATEVIISAFALSKGGTTYLRVVQLSLLGSVVSNLLLVMGTAFVAGGFKTKAQTFNQTGINVNCGMLVLGTFAIMMASLLDATQTVATDGHSELQLSRFMAILMVLCYGVYLFFQLKTHRHLYESSGEQPGTPAASAAATGSAALTVNRSAGRLSLNGSTPALTAVAGGPDGGDLEAPQRLQSLDGHSEGETPNAAYAQGKANELEMALVRGSKRGAETERQPLVGGLGSTSAVKSREGRTASGRSAAAGSERGSGRLATGSDAGSSEGGHGVGSGGGDDEDEKPELSLWGSMIWLTLVTFFVAFLSEFITDAIKGASQGLNIPLPFLTTIVLPIVGNAAEHASAIVFAFRNRIEIALGVAVGSSTQVAMCVVPFCVLLAWMMGQPLDLDFNSFEAFVLFGTVLLAVIVVQDGQANYLKGILLILTYIFISAGFWCHKDPNLTAI